MLTIAGAGMGIDIGPMAAAGLGRGAEKAGLSWPDDIEFPSIRVLSAEIACYADGDIIVEYPDGPPDDYEKVEYGFDIALQERGLVDCKPVVGLAEDLVGFVGKEVEGFDPLFA